MLVLNLPFKALMFLTLMRPSLVLFLVLWLKLVKDFLRVRCRLGLLPFLIRSEERFSRNAETDVACGLLLKKKEVNAIGDANPRVPTVAVLRMISMTTGSSTGVTRLVCAW